MTTRSPGAASMPAAPSPLNTPIASPVATLADWSAIVIASARTEVDGSVRPLALQPVAGVPMVRLICGLLRDLGCPRVVVVTDGDLDAFATAIGELGPVASTPLGSGASGALIAARDLIEPRGNVLVIPGDMPVLATRTLLAFAGRHLSGSEALTFLSAYLLDPRGHGRVQRRDGHVEGVARELDALSTSRGQLEVCAGLYAADAAWLFDAMSLLAPSADDEDALEGLVTLAVAGGGVNAFQVAEAVDVQHVTDRVQLAQADRVMRDRVRERLMRGGVTLMDPATIYVDAGVEVAPDTTLLPGTHLMGTTRIARGCTIGPNAILRDMTIGERCEIGGSTLEGSTLATGVTVGPYCHVRPGSTIDQVVHLGNYAEVKASHIGARTAVGHFSYIGDSEVGVDVNVGAGSITANYNGVEKHRTVIGDGVHLGSDTIMVAPVTIGAGASTGAGAVVVDDVAPGALVIGVPARPRGAAGEGGQAT